MASGRVADGVSSECDLGSSGRGGRAGREGTNRGRGKWGEENWKHVHRVISSCLVVFEGALSFISFLSQKILSFREYQVSADFNWKL